MQYKFVGNGAGIPGLPATVTQHDLDQMNADQTAEFEEALQMGLYVEITDDPKPVRKSKKAGTGSSLSAEGA